MTRCYVFQRESYASQSDERELYGIARKIVHMTQFRVQGCRQKSKRMAQPSVGIECRSKISWSMPRLASRLIFPKHPGEKSATILGRHAIGHATYHVVTVTN